MSEETQPPLCPSYRAGHNVHWIHAKKVASLVRYRVTDFDVNDDTGFVTFTARGKVRSFWTHNHLWLHAIQNHFGIRPIYWCPSPNTLFVETESSNAEHGRVSAMFYLTDDPVPCVEGVIPGHPIREIRTYDNDSHLRD